MNLCISKPQGCPKDVIYSLPFGFDGEGVAAEGHMCVAPERILIYKDDSLSEEYKIEDFQEFIVKRRAGSGMACAVTKGGEDICFCGFTLDLFLRFAELLKLLQHRLLTGELILHTDSDEPSCERCGMPLEGAAECVYCASKGAVMLRLAKRIAPYKRYFAAAVIFTILTELVYIVLPYINRIIIDDYVTPGNDDMAAILLLAAAVVLLVLMMNVFKYFNMKNSFKAALNLGRDLRQEVFDKAQQLSLKSASRHTAGELINRVSSDAAKLEEFITANGKDAIVKVMSLLFIGAMLFIMQPQLALLTVLPIPFVAIIENRLFRTMASRYGRVWKKSKEHGELLHDILNGIRVVKAYGSEAREIKRYSDCSEEWAKSAIKAEIVWYLTIPLADLLLTVGNLLIIYFGGRMILGGELTLGMLVQFTTYAAMLYEPIRWLIQLPRTLADASVSAGKVFEILDERSDVSDCENPQKLDIKGEIEFKNVYFGYKSYDPVLKDISCKIAPGEMIGIVGHSGVGKSTMINLIMRLYDCTSGGIYIDGVDIRSIEQKALRRQIGVVLQESFLFDGSVLDNITYAKPDADFADVVRAAKTAHAHEFILKLPDGYNTRVGDKGYQLSGGERQRIAIARAILHDPKIIILDEATASLDTVTEKQIQDALAALTKGKTTIAIAHRLSTLSNADRLFVLDKGRLAESGAHKELMRQKGVYYKLVMAQR